VAGLDPVDQGFLLARCEFELVVASVGVDDDEVVLVHRGSLEDRGVLVDGHFVPPGVFQGMGEVQCLIAIAVMAALSSGQEEHPDRDDPFGRLLLGPGRPGRQAIEGQGEDQGQRHGRGQGGDRGT